MKKIFAYVLILLSFGVNAEDSCRDILTNGFYNSLSKSSDQVRNQAVYAELCSANYQQAKNIVNRIKQSGSSGSIGVSYASVGLDFGSSENSGSSLTEEKFNQWQSQYCSKNSTTDSSRAAEYLMQKTVSESVVNAWSSCMQKIEGLTCYASPYDEEVLFNILWKKQSNTQPKVISSFLSKGVVAEFNGETQGKVLPYNYKLAPGTLQIPLRRQKENNIVANLNITHDGVNYSCGVFVPGEKYFEVTKSTLVQQVIKSPDIGCKAQASPFGSNCGGEWSYAAPTGYKVCSVGIRVTSGPTTGANFTLENPSSTAGSIKWSVVRDETPFGAGRWVNGFATVTYIPIDRNVSDNGSYCNPTTLMQL
ncbi:hypothetical protein [Acinetobacter sp. ANC 5502]